MNRDDASSCGEGGVRVEAGTAARNRGTASDLTVLGRRIRVALGREAGDLVLTGGCVVNVFTGQVQSANVVIADGGIAERLHRVIGPTWSPSMI